MDFLDECFLVFVRADTARGDEPETNEEPVAICDSYEQARRVKQDTSKKCVIRYAGCAGGGD
jgi:hypothetical protein